MLEKLRPFARSPYALWLAIGLIFAICGVGYDSPDEHFHTLEAAGRLLFGFGTRTWEWDEGHRSWIQPMILATVLKPGVSFGVENRLWLASMGRVFNVLWMLPGIWAMGRLSGSKNAVYGFACAWPLAAWGTRHGLDTFCIAPMLLGFALFLTTPRAFTAGLVLGAACAFRFTVGVPIVAGVAIALALRRRGIRSCAFAAIGFLLALAAFSAFDWRAYELIQGSPRLPIWEFFKFRILKGNGNFHASPWYELIITNLLIWSPPLCWL